MYCLLKKNFIFLVSVFIVANIAADENTQMKINVTADPALPSRNLLGENADFEKGTEGWELNNKAVQSKSIEPTEADGRKVISINSSEGVIGRTVILTKSFKVGEEYILSCLLKTDEKVSQKAGSFSGCGATFSFFQKDWKKAETVYARSASTDGKWVKAVSKPIACPEWAHLYRLHLGIMYSAGSGFIEKVVLTKAYTTIRIEVKASIDIRQVIVDNETGENFFDSDLLDEGKKTFTKTLKVLSPYQYHIKVLDANGGIYTAVYPEEK